MIHLSKAFLSDKLNARRIILFEFVIRNFTAPTLFSKKKVQIQGYLEKIRR